MNPTEARREFIKQMQTLCRRWNTWDVWSDWLVLASSSIYNAIHRDPTVEEEYLRVAKKYERDELDTMSRLVGITVMALEGSTHDFLGAVFHELELHNKHIGQFFTPYELCRMMAAMMKPEVPRPGRLLMVDEPACGSGSMILAFHETMREAGAPQNRMFYHLKDLDNRAFRMAYIQTSLCGMAAEVELGDTLRMTTDRIWRTPGYYLHDIPTRMRVDAMMRALPGDDHASTVPTPVSGRVPFQGEDGREPEVGQASANPVQAEPEPDPCPSDPPEARGADLFLPDVIMPKPGEHFSLF